MIKFLEQYRVIFDKPIYCKNIIATISFFILVIILLLIYGTNTIQYYDANRYVDLSESFSNLSFPNTIRGYSFPLIVFVLNKFVPVYIVAIIINSFCTVIISFYIFPKLFGVKHFCRQTVFKCLFVFFCMVYFWNGYFVYVLSDLISMTFFLLAVTLVLNNVRLKKFFFAGCFFALALNIRPVYQIVIPIFVLSFIWWTVFRYKYEKIICAILFVVGLVGCLVPQVAINHHYNKNTYSPFVQTGASGSSLYIEQLWWGLAVPEYATYIGNQSGYPTPSVFYVNNEGSLLYKDNKNHSLNNYFSILIQKPVFYIKNMVEHTWNGLDLKANTAYLTTVKVNYFISVLNYIVLYLFITIIWLRRKDASSLCRGDVFFVGANILLVTLIVIPTALESRFFWPLHTMIYFVTGYNIGYIKYLCSSKKIVFNLMLMVMFISICLMLTNYSQSHLSFMTRAEVLR